MRRWEYDRLAKLRPEVAADYNGFPEPLAAGPWANWKPSHAGPHDIAIVYSTTSNPYQNTLLESIQAGLKKSPSVGQVDLSLHGVDPAAAVQNFQAALGSKPDLILYQPLGKDSFVPLIDKAASEGIPSIAIQATLPTANSVNVTPNPYLLGAAPTAELVKIMGGTGTLLAVRGVPGVPIETQTFDGIKDVVSSCPNIKLDDSVVGQYNPGVAKDRGLEVPQYAPPTDRRRGPLGSDGFRDSQCLRAVRP